MPDQYSSTFPEVEARLLVRRFGRQNSVVGADGAKGLCPEKLAEIRSNASGVGILGMRERVLELGGHMNIDSDTFGTT